MPVRQCPPISHSYVWLYHIISARMISWSGTTTGRCPHLVPGHPPQPARCTVVTEGRDYCRSRKATIPCVSGFASYSKCAGPPLLCGSSQAYQVSALFLSALHLLDLESRRLHSRTRRYCGGIESGRSLQFGRALPFSDSDSASPRMPAHQ